MTSAGRDHSIWMLGCEGSQHAGETGWSASPTTASCLGEQTSLKTEHLHNLTFIVKSVYKSRARKHLYDSSSTRENILIITFWWLKNNIFTGLNKRRISSALSDAHGLSSRLWFEWRAEGGGTCKMRGDYDGGWGSVEPTTDPNIWSWLHLSVKKPNLITEFSHFYLRRHWVLFNCEMIQQISFYKNIIFPTEMWWSSRITHKI